MDKPYAPSCDNNRGPILAVLQQYFTTPATVLELGSGTGQHAAWLPAHLPHLTWQPSELAPNLPGIRAWLDDAALPNVTAPIPLDMAAPWPALDFDHLFSVNTFHILAADEVARAIATGGARLPARGLFVVYGPFNYDGDFTSDSNARFDGWLRARNPASGLRDQGWVVEQMQTAGLTLIADHAMPANNRTLVFRKA